MAIETTTAVSNPVEQPQQNPPSIGVDPGAFNPPADPTGYEIAYHDSDGNPIAELNAEQAQMDANVRQWAFDAGLPGGLVAALADIAQMPGEIQSPEEREAALQRVWPGGEYGERLGRAAAFIGELEAKQPGLVAFLEKSGLGNSPTFITMVEQHARTRGRRK